MAKKFFCKVGYGSSAETKEFSEDEYDQLIDWYTRQREVWEREPEVIFGENLEFEPREIIKSWGAKGWSKRGSMQ